jgi:hypothetical protein
MVKRECTRLLSPTYGADKLIALASHQGMALWLIEKCDVMQRRIGLGALVGFIVAGAWVILSFAIPISSQPVLWGLVRLTCPILPISLTFHFGVKWNWFVVLDVAAYVLIGFIFESLQLFRHRLQAPRLLA